MKATTKPRKNKPNRLPGRKRPKYRFSSDQDPIVPELARDLENTGKSIGQIAEEAEVSYGTVKRMIDCDVLYPRNYTVTRLSRVAGLRRVRINANYAGKSAGSVILRYDPLKIGRQIAALGHEIERIRQRAR